MITQKAYEEFKESYEPPSGHCSICATYVERLINWGSAGLLCGNCVIEQPEFWKERAIGKAREWRDEHEEHVKKLESGCPHCYEPSAEDFANPHLWKAASWVWLRTTFPQGPTN